MSCRNVPDWSSNLILSPSRQQTPEARGVWAFEAWTWNNTTWLAWKSSPCSLLTHSCFGEIYREKHHIEFQRRTRHWHGNKRPSKCNPFPFPNVCTHAQTHTHLFTYLEGRAGPCNSIETERQSECGRFLDLWVRFLFRSGCPGRSFHFKQLLQQQQFLKHSNHTCAERCESLMSTVMSNQLWRRGRKHLQFSAFLSHGEPSETRD